MTYPRVLTENELIAWTAELAEREEALEADEAAFREHVAEFERRAEALVTEKATDLHHALKIVRQAFPGGITFQAWGPEPGGAVH